MKHFITFAKLTSRFQCAFALVAYAFASVLMSAQSSNPERPNIIFWITDDGGWPWQSVYIKEQYGIEFEDSWIQTPAFDRLAAEGALFHRAYSQSPQCAPSRASILTGRYPQFTREGVHMYGFIPTQLPTFPRLLEQSGYHIAHIGKGSGPGNVSFSGSDARPEGEAFEPHSIDPPIPSTMSSVDYAANVIEYINFVPEGEPFCVWVGTSEPHAPFGVAPGITDQAIDSVVTITTVPDTRDSRKSHLNMAFEVEYQDGHLGQVLDYLDANNLSQNTIVIATADHGLVLWYAKGHLTEFGLHVPLAIRWPQQIQAGTVVEEIVELIDIMPTLLNAAGIEDQPYLDGQDIMMLFDPETKSAWQNYAMGAIERVLDRGTSNPRMYPIRCLFKDDYLLSWFFNQTDVPLGDRRMPESAITDDCEGYWTCNQHSTELYRDYDDVTISEAFQVVNGPNPQFRLFHIETDLGCFRDLANDPDYKATFEVMQGDLRILLEKKGDPRLMGYGDIFLADTYSKPKTTGYAESYHMQYHDQVMAWMFQDPDNDGIPSWEELITGGHPLYARSDDRAFHLYKNSDQELVLSIDPDRAVFPLNVDLFSSGDLIQWQLTPGGALELEPGQPLFFKAIPRFELISNPSLNDN